MTSNKLLVLNVVVTLVLVGGLVTGFHLVQQEQNIFGKAWSGVTANAELLQSRLGLKASPIASLPTQAKSKDLYSRLIDTYPTAEVQDIDFPAVEIRGKAYLYYDPLIEKTYVFSRIDNLPWLEGKIVRLWLTDNLNYLPVGIGEFVQEDGKAVTYSVFVKPGDLRTNYKELVLSWESSLQATTPTARFLNLKL